jgi:hypothetical protein
VAVNGYKYYADKIVCKSKEIAMCGFNWDDCEGEDTSLSYSGPDEE